jgi:hypothetical protein
VNIHDHCSRFEFGCKEYGLFAIDRFSDDCEVVIRFDHLAQELSNVGMVIDEENLEGARM